MTPRNTLVVVTVLFVAVMSNNSQGQTLLEQIEKRLNQLPKPNKAKTEKQPPADELPAPAKKAQGKPGVLGLSGDDQGEANGITVTAVAKKGPAEAAGIQVGDLIISADGLATKELDDLAAITAIKKAGDELRLGLRRKGQAVNVTLKLASAAAGQPEPAPSEDTIPLPPAPTAPGAGPAAPPATPAPMAQGATLGVTVNPVTAETRFRYALSVNQGAVITSVVAGGPAARYGLPVGGVIIAFGNQKVDNPDQLVGALSQSNVGEEVELTYYHGPQVYRKKVRLGPKAATSNRPLATSRPDPRPRSNTRRRLPLGDALGDRPLVRRLENLIDRVGPNVLPAPSGAPAAAPPAGPEEPPVEPPAAATNSQLQQQVTDLQEQVRLLQERLARLEAKLSEKEK